MIPWFMRNILWIGIAAQIVMAVTLLALAAEAQTCGFTLEQVAKCK